MAHDIHNPKPNAAKREVRPIPPPSSEKVAPSQEGPERRGDDRPGTEGFDKDQPSEPAGGPNPGRYDKGR